jgi:hypothetical protein
MHKPALGAYRRNILTILVFATTLVVAATFTLLLAFDRSYLPVAVAADFTFFIVNTIAYTLGYYRCIAL